MQGLALAGGGVKGSYQIGAYMALKECGIKIDGVVGCSIGAFNAAMIACGKENELLSFWQNIDVGELLGFNKKYVDSVNNEEHFKEFIYGLQEMTHIIKNKGITNEYIYKELKNMLDEDKLFKSPMDFGLITVRLKDLKPLYLFKKDMTKGKICEYVLASCNLPVFKKTNYIDDKYYIDGGFYDNNPVNMLINAGYDKIYSIEIQGIGVKRKVIDDSKVITIKPSRYLGTTLNVNKKKINDNIKLGYYDTLKVIKKLDGYNFIFKNTNTLIYNILVSHTNIDNRKRVMRFFNTSDNKEVVLKSLEYIMLKEKETYYNIYNVLKEIKYIKKHYNNDDFIYEFVKSLRIL